MKAERLNSFFADYQADLEKGLNPLLSAVRSIALHVFLDEDAAQDFTIGVWQVLPTLSSTGSFARWLHQRLNWRVQDHRRCAEHRADWMQQAPESLDEDGESLSNEESLELVSFRWRQSIGELNSAFEPARKSPDLDSIADPTVRMVAEMMLSGQSQVEIAQALGLNINTLRSRLSYYRHRQRKSAA
jgi:DNA-directed RNA polymerase specialized sigma24 family protein